MNLQQITTDLDRTIRRQLRRTNTLQNWASEHPTLEPSIDTLLDQMRDLDRDISHPVLAVLVGMAKTGDQHAAQLVTVGLLQKFADKEKAKGGTWDQFPGHLYEAIVTCYSTQSRCLREIIERNALRRNLKTRTLGANDVHLDRVDLIPSDEPDPETVAVRSITRSEVLAMVDRLARERHVTETTRTVLHHVATGSDPTLIAEFAGRSANTVRTRCRRAAHSLRNQQLQAELVASIW
jgi:DNA-binding CsgD family transcriptional regulator